MDDKLYKPLAGDRSLNNRRVVSVSCRTPCRVFGDSSASSHQEQVPDQIIVSCLVAVHLKG